MKRGLYILVLQLFFIASVSAEAIGSWKAYLAYNDITELQEAGNIIYVLASKNLYAYNTNDLSTQTFSKMDVLSDVWIDHIAYNKTSKRLIVVYENQNIDLLENNGNVVNISDIMTKSMVADKTINHVYIYNEFAYLSTGFGIIKLNTAKAEIGDTYNLGFDVAYSYIENGNIYAVSETNGKYMAKLSTNLLDKKNWNRVGEYTEINTTPDETLLQRVANARPGGPKYNYFGFMRFVGDKLYTCAGGYVASVDHYYPGIIQVMNSDDDWQIYEENLSTKTGHNYIDIMEVDVDPRDAKRVFAGSKGGVYEFYDGQFVKEWSYDNSIIQSLTGGTNKNYTIVKSVKFDAQGNLWMLNSVVPDQSIIEYTAAGEWVSHHKRELLYGDNTLNHMEGLMIDSRGLLWFVTNTWDIPTLSCYNPQTDEIHTYRSFVNQDGATLAINSAQCVTEDKEGNIWIGTQIGPLMIEAADVASDNPVFVQVKVPRNDGSNYADYLLSGVNVTKIVVDGGNRKWFGTNGQGIYLISSNNIEEISHFTTENSCLLSDYIESLTMNDKSGELFIGTTKGLCSYMTDATTPAAEMNKDDVYAYPNPVTPDYTGPITIVGLSYNAFVKITTVNGTLIAEGRSNGGSFTWDGCDAQGRRVASGIYMVQTATEDGGKGTVCKIAIVN